MYAWRIEQMSWDVEDESLKARMCNFLEHCELAFHSVAAQ